MAIELWPLELLLWSIDKKHYYAFETVYTVLIIIIMVMMSKKVWQFDPAKGQLF